MADFFNALINPDLPFLRYALIAGVLSSFSLGMVGTYVVTRRISYIAGAIAHSVLGGIGTALFFQHKAGWAWFDPIIGALIAAILSAVIIGLVSMYARQREDTVIGSIWAVGMAMGVLFIAKTPGYIDPMSYLFGNILLISSTDLWLIIILDTLVLGVGIIFYNKFLAICFDEQFARLRGINVTFYYLLMLIMVALTVVLMVMIVGIILVIALLTIPAAISGMFSRQLWQIMIFSTILCILFTVTGLGVSYNLDFPTGSTIIVLAGIVYLLILVFNLIVRKRLS
ncbi:MAG: metal ABC transporter permease [candidate division Zixibacteria bacterium]|nr:metal ABC transporter permease [candidate division Zixibacteria bacterium]NIT54184.1 metal ABC transporter permease [candidate division Zixibacteria bacterium]NIW42689.1 iron chelate uptake ABC transporter family permease subunit [candidate division Zixibacteria bacterium]NIX57050.1 iron chelate uptake ABC transporter family permease subunit [candidate division Zixibacteria bacterium]